MKYATFSIPPDPTLRLGIVQEDSLYELRALLGARWKGKGPLPASLLEVIDAGPSVWKQLASQLPEVLGDQSKPHKGYSLDKVRLHAPIPRPRKNVFCLGLNYVSHMVESARARGREAKIPEVPVFFTKSPTTVNGPYDAVPWDAALTGQLDYEAELGVVIGVGGKNIPEADALRHVFGYTVINDVSARDLQQRHMQWFKGKSLDGCCPMGPWVVTADEFGDPQDKKIWLRVNDVEKQSSTTAKMIFSVARTIEFLSRGMTIEPGDIISTGTPEGVGMGRTPQEFLSDGDVVEAYVEGIGSIRNRIQKTQP